MHLKLPDSNQTRTKRSAASLIDAYRWCDLLWDKLLEYDSGDTAEDGAALTAALSGRRLSVSTAFSGIGTPELACSTIGKSARRFVASQWSGPPGDVPVALSFQQVWACEKSSKARAELLISPSKPQHLYQDIKSFLPAGARRLAEKGGLHLPGQAMTSCTQSTCLVCKGTCSPESTLLHIAGSPCQDFSSYGKRLGQLGPRMGDFQAWAAMVLTLAFAVVVHENVTQCGKEALED